MAYDKPPSGLTHTFPASTGLKQYQFVNITGANNRLINPTTNGEAIGVITSSGTTGSTGRAGSTDSGSVQTVQLLGVAKIICGTTAIDPGDFIKASTDGRGSTWDLSDGSTDYVVGRAIGSALSTTTSAEIITAFINGLGFGVYGGVSTA